MHARAYVHGYVRLHARACVHGYVLMRCPRVCPYAYVYACAYAQYAASENQASTLTLTSNKVVNLRTAALLKGNCHERRMHLSKVVCGNMPGFLATFRSRNLLFCL